MTAKYKQPPKLQSGMFVILRDHKTGLIVNDIIMGLNWFNPVSFYSNRDGRIQSWRWKFTSDKDFIRGSMTDIIALYDVKDVGICLEDIMKEENLKNYGKLLWREEA